jgi:predicted CXXCH cytochrome family protein
MYKVAFKSILASLLLLVLSTVPALAVKGTPNVANTVHNLSSANAYFGGLGSPNEDEVCIFCHTPHGGSLTGPLWNRANSAQVYTHYTSSTLSTQVAASRGTNIYDESRLCLSCHDGSISMYTVMNANNVTGQPLPFWGTGEMRGATGLTQGPRIGMGRNADGTVNEVSDDLSDDHPISFKYLPVLTDAAKDSNRLQTIAYAEGQGVRFFPIGAADADKRVECSSCHDPHVDYTTSAAYTPFLITPNAGSALCLACHNK